MVADISSSTSSTDDSTRRTTTTSSRGVGCGGGGPGEERGLQLVQVSSAVGGDAVLGDVELVAEAGGVLDVEADGAALNELVRAPVLVV